MIFKGGNTMVKRIYTTLIFLGILVSSYAQAHVKWFVSKVDEPVEYEFGFLYYLVLMLCVVYAFVVFRVDSILSDFYKKRFFSLWPGLNQWRILSISCGLLLLYSSYYGDFLAPNVDVSLLLDYSIIIQAVAGFMLVISCPLRMMSLGVVAVLAIVVVYTPVQIWIDYVFEFVAVFIALWMSSRKGGLALTVLRVGLGLQLIVLAVHNKLLDPSLGIKFLSMHDWNFMSFLGFDDLLFVFCCAVAELTFGFLILIGVGTRVVLAMVATFFMLTSILLGPHELAGHLPILVCCTTLISLGGGYSFRYILECKRRYIQGRLQAILG